MCNSVKEPSEYFSLSKGWQAKIKNSKTSGRAGPETNSQFCSLKTWFQIRFGGDYKKDVALYCTVYGLNDI